ncbi:sensor domain-containing protein (plasmid) [Mycobacterium avium subsp. hominissuis]|uniref:sensor domain-containing protein n=1 Tax=Mycobacterium avium TaxID=1764 RepID=UPI00313FF9CA
MSSNSIQLASTPATNALTHARLQIHHGGRGVAARRAVTASLLLVLAGCAATVTGHQEPGAAARHASDLNTVLLTPEEVDTSIAAAGVQIDTTQSTLVDDSPYTTPLTCLAVSSMGQEHVYDRTQWTSARMQSMHEPGDSYAHLVHQAVVELPDAGAANAFYARSARDWAACAPGRYTYSAEADQDAAVWDVGPVADLNHVLTATITESDSDDWSCQRALTTSLNVVVDVLSCSATPAQSAATVAQKIAAKITDD